MQMSTRKTFRKKALALGFANGSAISSWHKSRRQSTSVTHPLPTEPPVQLLRYHLMESTNPRFYPSEQPDLTVQSIDIRAYSGNGALFYNENSQKEFALFRND